MRTKRRKVSARWLAGVVLVLACGVAEGRAETWEKLGTMVVPKFECEGAAAKEVLDCIGEITGMGVRVKPGDALEGKPPLTIHWQGASVRDIALGVGEILCLRVELEEDGSGFVFRRDYSGWGMQVVEDGSGGTGGTGGTGEKDVKEGAEESFAGDESVVLTIAEDVHSCTRTVKDFEEQARRESNEAVRWNADVKVEGDEIRVTLSQDGVGEGEAE